MQHSETIANLSKALVEAQLELDNPGKNKQGYGYAYADLASIIDQVKPVLAKHKLTVIQTPSQTDNGKIGVTTMLIHESGEYIAGTIELPIPDMKSANVTQQAGAAYTYARRYALTGVLGISADEDTDGATVKKVNKAVSKQEATADGPCPICHAPAGKPHATGCKNA